jgi:hypothetical protein
MKKSKPNIRSGEFRSWSYCPRQWYLLRTTKRRINTAASRKGMEFHRSHSQKVEAVQKAQSNFKTIIVGGIVCLLLWFLLR